MSNPNINISALVTAQKSAITGRFDASGFGAVGDGTTDDTSACNALLAAAAGGVAYFKPGTYRLTAPLVLPSNTHITADDGVIWLRDHTTASSGGATFINADFTNGNTNITIQGGKIAASSLMKTGKQIYFQNVTGFKLTGLDIGTSNGDWMATFKNCYDFVISNGIWNCNGGNLYNDGLHIYGGGRGTITGMRITAGDDALALTNEAVDCAWIEHVTVDNCVLESNAASMIKIAVAAGVINGIRHIRISNISGRKMSGSGSIPVWAYDASASDTMVYDVTINGLSVDCQSVTGAAVQAQGVDGLVLSNITVRNPSGRPLWIDSGTNAAVQNLSITGTPTGGSFTITDPISGQTTSAISYAPLASDIQSALTSLSNLSSTSVSGSGTNFVITLPASTPVKTGWSGLSITNSLTGGTSPTIIMTNPNLQSYDTVISNFRHNGGQSAANQPNIRIDRSTDVQVISPRVSGATGIGILIGSGGQCTDVLISGGTVVNASGAAAIRIVNVSGYRIQSVRIKGCLSPLIEDSPSTNGVVRNNDFRSNTVSNNPSTYSGSNIDIANNVGTSLASASSPSLFVPPTSVVPLSATAWPAANRAVFARFNVSVSSIVRYVNWRVDTSSGNVQVGIVGLSGTNHTTFTPVVATSIFTCPAAGDIRTDLGATTLAPGDYAVFLWSDNTTLQTRYGTSSSYAGMRYTGQASNLTTGIPNTGSLAWAIAFTQLTVEADI